MAIDFITFFTDAGLAFGAGVVNNNSALTLVPDEVEEFLQGVTGSIDIHKAVDRVAGAIAPFQSAAASLNDTVIRQSIRNLLVQMINDDKPQPSLTVNDAIEQLVDQMDNAAETVDLSVLTCSSTYGSTMITTGTDDTSTNAAFLTDSTASFRVNGLIGHVLYNVTDGSSGVVTANTATTVTATLSGGSENDWDSGESYSITSTAVGDGVIVCSTKRGDGKINEHIIAELIEGTVTSTATDGTGTIELQGEFLASSKMAVDWPKGSAVNSTITSGAASGTNLVNGTFETEDTESIHLPLGWIVGTAELGTTMKLTPIEIQTVIISGAPTGGSYVLKFTDRDGDVQTTIPIAWDASGSTVQTALTSLVGLGSVTIVTTGTSPDFTHTITFTDVPNPGTLGNGGFSGTHTGAANQAVLTDASATWGTGSLVGKTITNTTDSSTAVITANTPNTVTGVLGGGTDDDWDNLDAYVIGDLSGGEPVIAHAVTTAGSASIMRGARAMEFVGNGGGSGSETTDIYFPLTSLTSNQQLAFNSWVKQTGAPGDGVITISIVDGISGSVISDDAGTANSTTITVSGLTTSYVAYNTTFRIPDVIPPVAYLRVQASTAITSGNSVFFDEMILKEMDQLYSGGPSVSAFSGIVDWALTDTATITTTNDRGLATTGTVGKSLNEWMNRVFDLDTRDLLLPSSATPTQDGSTLIS